LGLLDKFSFKRSLNLGVLDVQKLISAGQLKLVDTFVTDRAFEEFCRKHGNAINMALIDPSTRKWLVSEYGVPDSVEDKKLPRAQKHALIIRACKCGRKIAGNVYFRHLRHCRQLNAESQQINHAQLGFRPRCDGRFFSAVTHPLWNTELVRKTAPCPEVELKKSTMLKHLGR